VARTLLLDTGFLVALVNRRDPDHRRCVDVWAELHARFVTVEGVFVEAAHLLRRSPAAVEAAFRVGLAVGVSLVTPSAERYQRALALMRRYRNVPMDFVDAMLVLAAEDLAISEVLTLDRRGFETYRTRRGAFTLLPA